MDLTRFFLYTALAVITYLMLLAWQEDYPPVVDNGQDSASVSQETPTQFPGQTPAGSSDIPDDVPSAPAPAGNAPAPAVATSAPASRGGMVSVTTDTFELAIDLNGGDIVSLSLPEYLTALEEDSDPFPLLTNTSQRTYVAQSGLIGPDGIRGGSYKYDESPIPCP